MTIHNRLVALGVLGVALATPQLVLAQSQSPRTEIARARENARRRSCQLNLKQISLGVFQYAQDYNGKMPPARRWIDSLMPYLKNEGIVNCPALQAPRRYGYAFNANLAGQLQSRVKNPWQVAMVYETTLLKRNAFGKGTSRAFRHIGGANYAYADGHVKWIAKAKAAPGFSLKG